jgi:hypothetical protein
MRPIVKTVGPLAAAVANSIAISQSRGSAGALTLNGPLAASQTAFVPNIGNVSGIVALLDKPRRIAITSSGNDAAVIFTIVGTNWTGQTVTETLGGANAGSATSALDYATITGITTSGATASTVTVGTSAVAGTEWFRLSEWGSPKTSIQVDTAGTVNYTLQQSLDDPNDPTNPTPASLMTWVNHPDPAAVGASGPIQTSYDHVPRWLRCVLNSGTGAVTITAAQSGGVLS